MFLLYYRASNKALIDRRVTATAASAEVLLARTFADTLVGSFGLEFMVELWCQNGSENGSKIDFMATKISL